MNDGAVKYRTSEHHTHRHTHTHTHTTHTHHTHTHTPHIHTHTHTTQRLKTRIPITPEFTALVTGHGITISYLHRFKLADEPMCLCNEGRQTSDHVIFDCNLLETQIAPTIKKVVDSGGSWPPAKDELTTKYLHAFSIFVKSIDFQTLN